MPETPEPNIYQLRVVLLGISPIIWRRLLVRSDSTIADLHDTLQITFGWSDDHLHCFIIHGRQYGITYLGGIAFRDDPRRIKLSDLGLRVKEKFLYEYEFNDQWRHLIRVEAILPMEPDRFYPICISGKRAAPPEDCGGDRKKPGELCSSRLPLGLRIESRIPLLEVVSELFIQNSRPYLQEQMGAAATPAHLLFFDEPLA